MGQLRNKAPKWQHDLFIDLLEDCYKILYIHGFLTQKEKSAVKKRLHSALLKEDKRESEKIKDSILHMWADSEGVLHQCEGGECVPGKHNTYVVWTLCNKDVPANESFKFDADEVSCLTCLNRRRGAKI